MSRFHDSEAYRRAKRAFWLGLEARGVLSVPCSRCHRPVDCSSANAGRNPTSRSVEHTVPVSRGGNLTDISEWVVSHLVCNNRAP